MTGTRTSTRRAVLAGAAIACGVAAVGMTGGPADAAPALPGALPAVSTFSSLATGYALDSNSSGSVYALPGNGGNYQKWYVRASTYGTVTVQDVATGRCLDSNTSRNVYTLPCNGGSFQKWVVLTSDYGTVVLRDLATGYVLDGNAAHSVYTSGQNGGSYQKWFARAA